MSVVIDPEGSAVDRAVELGRLGSYQLLERIGAGAIGEVFRARDTRHGRTVAVKKITAGLAADSDRLAELTKTASRLTSISHPGVAMLYECDSDDGQWFLAQEFVAGQSLTQLLGGQPLNPRRAVDLAIEIADAIAALHAEGLRHGDLRPDVVMVTQKGHVKLLDAGLAAFTGGGAVRASASRRLGSLTPGALPVVRALSPEEAMGEGGDARADLFGLGAILYQMLTGQPPFDRPTADEALLAVMRSTPPLPSARQPKVTPELDRVVARALAKSLASRYQTAQAIGGDLRVLKAALDIEAAQAPPPRVVVKVSRQPVWWWVAALVTIAGLAGWWLLGR